MRGRLTITVMLACGLLVGAAGCQQQSAKTMDATVESKTATQAAPEKLTQWTAEKTARLNTYLQRYAAKQDATVQTATPAKPAQFNGYTWPDVYSQLHAQTTGRKIFVRSGAETVNDDNYTVVATYALQIRNQQKPYVLYALALRNGVADLYMVEFTSTDGKQQPVLNLLDMLPNQLGDAMTSIKHAKTPTAPKREPLRNQYDAVALLTRRYGTSDARGEFTWVTAPDYEAAVVNSGHNQYFVVAKYYKTATDGSDRAENYYVNVRTQQVIRANSAAGTKLEAGKVYVNISDL
jgi:hypothetical protein